jgi:CheY-like chemotaxis protein
MRSAVSYRAQNPALILLVDDNHDGIVARRSVLEELGYKVISACCGSEALELASSQNFDLIITDYRMKPMDGLQFIAEVRARGYQKPVILLSGFADSLGLQEQNTGADVVIQKSANEISALLRHTKRLLNPKKPTKSTARRSKRSSPGRTEI